MSNLQLAAAPRSGVMSADEIDSFRRGEPAVLEAVYRCHFRLVTHVLRSGMDDFDPL
jgi:hypothetical protein